MRNRGTTICDIAILVIDVMHGIENTTREALDLLKKHKVPFIVALNKVDRLFDWKSAPDAPILDQLKLQSEQTRDEYEKRWESIKAELKTLGIPAMPYYQTPDFRKFVSVVPISALTGEGALFSIPKGYCGNIDDRWIQEFVISSSS
jgi:translation initiation factor 5B